MKLFFRRSTLAGWLIAGILFASGCAHYDPHAFESLRYKNENVAKCARNIDGKTGAVTLYASRLSPGEEKFYFDRNIHAKGYQTVLFTIQNDSAYDLRLDNEDIVPTVAKSETVAELLHTSTAGRSAAYGTAGLLLCAPLLIPAVIDGIKSSNANKQVDADISDRARAYVNIPAEAQRNHAIFMGKDSIREDGIRLRMRVLEHPSVKFLEFHLPI
jgi:hypothetical protein